MLGRSCFAATVLGALCLSQAGCTLVEQAKPLTKLMAGLCSEKVVLYVQGNCPSNLGVQLEELMRHNPSLLDSCMAGCVEMANKIPQQLEQLGASDSSAVASALPLTKQGYLLCAVEFLGKLLEPLMSAAEHSRAFVRLGGVDSLLRILSLAHLPPNFSRSEAGRFLSLVVGKVAFHASAEVLGEVMARTLKLLKDVKEHYSKANILLIASTGQDSGAAAGKELLLSLELHTSLLSGIVGSFRGSSTGIDWDSAQGTELVQMCAECYVALRLANCAMTKETETSTQSVEGSEQQAASDADASAQQSGDAEQQGMEGGGEALHVLDAIATGDPGPAPASVSEEQDMNAKTSSSLASLLMRISNTLSLPQRRRGDDRTTNEKMQERAVAVAGALCKLLEVDTRELSPVKRLPTCLVEVLANMSMCLFGADDPTRASSRANINMMLLQAFVQSKSCIAGTQSGASLHCRFPP